MPEVSLEALRTAVRHLHQCDAVFVESVPVVETFQGKTVWQGAVVVFDLIGHPTATRAYAWSSVVDRPPKPDQASKRRIVDRRRFTAVLHAGKVDSPVAAVRASIIAENRHA